MNREEQRLARMEEHAADRDRQNNWREPGFVILITPNGTESWRCTQAYAEKWCGNHPGWTWRIE